MFTLLSWKILQVVPGGDRWLLSASLFLPEVSPFPLNILFYPRPPLSQSPYLNGIVGFVFMESALRLLYVNVNMSFKKIVSLKYKKSSVGTAVEPVL